MDDGIDRWSQIVRTPGTVKLTGHHADVVPAEGAGVGGANGRPGVRLMVHPVATARPVYLLDVTSTAVQAMLEGFLRTGVAEGKFLSWSTSGFGRRRRDTIHIKSRLS